MTLSSMKRGMHSVLVRQRFNRIFVCLGFTDATLAVICVLTENDNVSKGDSVDNRKTIKKRTRGNKYRQ